MSVAAELESSIIQDTRDLQSACANILVSGTIEQVSYLFDPPALLADLANIDLDTLERMDAALKSSGYLSGTRPASVPQAGPSTETPAPVAGPSSSTRRASSNVVEHPPIAVLVPDPPAREVPEAARLFDEDELAMSGIEDAPARSVSAMGKDAAEDASEV